VKLERRDCLKLGAVAGAGALLSGCSTITRRFTHPTPPKSVALPVGDVEPTTRLVNRVSFGPTPGEIERVAKMGPESYVTEQLHFDDAIEPRIVALRISSLEALQINAAELGDLPLTEVLRQLEQASIIRAVYSPHQLRERMVEFWSNHFNIYARKGVGVWFKPTDEIQVIRKHALGTFPDLLKASAHSPAMLQYLDNQVNRRKDEKGAGANENYARELMELHSLGVHGGYSQKDVQEVARCLTGWTVEDRNWFPHKGTFRFDADRHDSGTKTVLGIKIPAGRGIEDGDQVLDILSRHPSTAKFISHKLCRYFLGDDADKWTDKIADIYLKTDGDIKQMLRPLLLSEELKSGPPILKRPFDFTVSALRALNADTDGGKPIQEHLGRMGQPLYQWPMPDGYPDRTGAWTGSLLARWNFATNLLTGGVPGTTIDLPGLMKVSGATTPAQSTDALLQMLLARHPASEGVAPLREKILAHATKVAKTGDTKRSAPQECAALIISSPEFQWR
jgi:uncharacterized protein (DUF1800 family)